uniref:4Fe-4S ferredoxin-type domain-containing protein n=1 Tax=Desulfatirhabdium butyrativorans TaxID=340467 RepID=A0A7C4RR94_9BACT
MILSDASPAAIQEGSEPHPAIRNGIESDSRANTFLCWSCGSCDNECPVSISSGKLRPQRMVRLTTYGLLEELLRSPEIWYCIGCRRCFQICPNLVKPCDIIAYARQETLTRNVLRYSDKRRYDSLYARFQRVRWHVVDQCLNNRLENLTPGTVRRWLDEDIPEIHYTISMKDIGSASSSFGPFVDESRFQSCFTCGSCSSACPISCEPAVFDPRSIIRLVMFGLTEHLLTSPAIWMCLSCGRCTDACPQRVDILKTIHHLQELAVFRKRVPSETHFRIKQALLWTYSIFTDRVDELFGIE